ncbi:hypothetical protein K474DRAFT_1657263 [Panus rudis PR-1116 ss-1]|nr:hypothetical protein K474DRAFT_1657263 [Panus rudis PR-1116 ss-1]
MQMPFNLQILFIIALVARAVSGQFCRTDSDCPDNELCCIVIEASGSCIAESACVDFRCNTALGVGVCDA